MLTAKPTKDPAPLYVVARKLPNGSVEITKSNGHHWLFIDKYHGSRPTYRNRYITLNCFRYHILWDKPLPKC
jgi:hypothetical protein